MYPAAMLDTMPRPAGLPEERGYAALTVRIPTDLLEDLREVARQKERSLNWVAARVLRRGLEELQREGWATRD
jgi:predicted transcriptional regulator